MLGPVLKKEVPLAFKMLRRDARSGELTVLVAAIVIAVVIVTAISLFAERLQKALVAEAGVFLAADVVLQSSEPVDEKWLANISSQSLRKAKIIQFASMAYAGDDMVLASVKAVSDSYPLLGKLEVSDQAFGVGSKVAGGPHAGEAWLDSRLLGLLNLQLGGKVWVGEKFFVVKKVLIREPDSGSSYWSLGPRILINFDDLAATGVIQPGSRVEYRYLFAGDKTAVDNYTQWLRQQLQDKNLHKHDRLITLQDNQPGLAQSLDKAEHFLLLAGSLGVLLASIAIAMAARRYSVRHFDAVAMMKTLGATPQALSQLFALQLLFILLVSIMIGSALGALVQYAFLYVMRAWLPALLPAASFKPYIVGALTGVICTAVFALPMLWQLRVVLPLRVLRRELGNELSASRGFYLSGALAIFLLMVFYSQNLRLAAMVFGGVVACAFITAVLVWLLFKCLQHLGFAGRGTQAGNAWRLALANLRRNQWQTILQIVMFSLALMLLLITVLIRGSLVSEWQKELPENTPNHFLINIAPYQLQSVQKLLTEHQFTTAGFYPMVRGRLTTINGIDATTVVPDTVDEVYRELNLTWSTSLPEDNKLIAGEWWSTPSTVSASQVPVRVSIEQGLAKKLKVGVGDQVLFMVGDQPVNAVISSVRELSWDRMRPNFYFIFEPGALDNLPAMYITSFYLPKAQKLFLNSLLKKFPTVSIFEVDEMIARIQKIVIQVTQAIELVLGLIGVAAALVLVACVQASLDQRLRESALLRTLGAGKKLLIGSLALEFLLLGLLAGVMAVVGSEMTAWALQTQLFKMDYHLHTWLWLSGSVMGALVVGMLGLVACVKVIRVPPLILLREQ